MRCVSLRNMVTSNQDRDLWDLEYSQRWHQFFHCLLWVIDSRQVQLDGIMQILSHSITSIMLSHKNITPAASEMPAYFIPFSDLIISIFRCSIIRFSDQIIPFGVHEVESKSNHLYNNCTLDPHSCSVPVSEHGWIMASEISVFH